MKEETANAKKSPVIKIILMILASGILLCGIGGGAFVLGSKYKDYFDKNKKEDVENTEEENLEEEEVENEEDVETTTYTGDTFQAELPQDWTMIEYYDGDGSESMVSGVDYSGLTGFEVRKNNIMVFKVSAVSGIGGVQGCSDIHKFADTSMTYVNEIINLSAEVGTTTNIVDYTSVDYSAITYLDRVLCRVNKTFFWDMNTATASFDTNCGLDGSAFPMGDVEFVMDEGTPMESSSGLYWYDVSDTASAGDLTTLETILESVEEL